MIYATRRPLVLASNSPRRKAFFNDLGLEFIIRAEEIDETPEENELPEQFVERMAREKAAAIGELCPDSFIVAADTVVCIDEQILGKPANSEDAVQTLMALSGRIHLVRTGFCVLNVSDNVEIVQSVVTRVRFSQFDERVARSYVQCGECLDKAGSYGIQGKGAFLVERIEGSYSNVVGLPLAEVIDVLEHLEVIGVMDYV